MTPIRSTTSMILDGTVILTLLRHHIARLETLEQLRDGTPASTHRSMWANVVSCVSVFDDILPLNVGDMTRRLRQVACELFVILADDASRPDQSRSSKTK